VAAVSPQSGSEALQPESEPLEVEQQQEAAVHQPALAAVAEAHPVAAALP